MINLSITSPPTLKMPAKISLAPLLLICLSLRCQHNKLQFYIKLYSVDNKDKGGFLQAYSRKQHRYRRHKRKEPRLATVPRLTAFRNIHLTNRGLVLHPKDLRRLPRTALASQWAAIYQRTKIQTQIALFTRTNKVRLIIAALNLTWIPNKMTLL